MDDPRAREIADYVARKLLVDPARAFDADTRLLSDGLIDSMGMVMLAAFVEERFGARIDDADLRAGGLERIADLVALLDRR